MMKTMTKPTEMTNEPDHKNSENPGPGWERLSPGDTKQPGDVYWSNTGWKETTLNGNPATPYHWRFRPVPLPLSPEEQVIVDAMRAGRKVTVEEPQKTNMPRRCQVYYCEEAGGDPWATAWPINSKRDYIDTGGYALVQLIELTQEVSDALMVAGITWEDAPEQVPLPDGLKPLPEGAVYLGRGESFTPPTEGFSGWACRGGELWKWDSAYWGNVESQHYAAPADSVVVKMNLRK